MFIHHGKQQYTEDLGEDHCLSSNSDRCIQCRKRFKVRFLEIIETYESPCSIVQLINSFTPREFVSLCFQVIAAQNNVITQLYRRKCEH